ncbi:hypothetical protein, partial [Thiolapillus sp.]|uniref:hypothetical protein n=1 Tax=Thiolapillus sp. TaxID=2017437 RepID=UPI003AF79766
MTRTAGAPIGCQRPSRFWGLGCPKIFHEAEDTLVQFHPRPCALGQLRGQEFHRPPAHQAPCRELGEELPGTTA